MNQAVAQHLLPVRAALRARWAALDTRERRLLQFAAAVVGLALLWWWLLGPALRTVRDAPAERQALDLQLQHMQVLATEAKALRAVAPIPPGQGQAALQAAAGRLGERARLSLQGTRAVLTLQGVTGAELAALLQEARTGARARVAEANLTPSSPGVLQGSLTLSLGGASP